MSRRRTSRGNSMRPNNRFWEMERNESRLGQAKEIMLVPIGLASAAAKGLAGGALLLLASPVWVLQLHLDQRRKDRDRALRMWTEMTAPVDPQAREYALSPEGRLAARRAIKEIYPDVDLDDVFARGVETGWWDK